MFIDPYYTPIRGNGKRADTGWGRFARRSGDGADNFQFRRLSERYGKFSRLLRAKLDKRYKKKSETVLYINGSIRSTSTTSRFSSRHLTSTMRSNTSGHRCSDSASRRNSKKEWKYRHHYWTGRIKVGKVQSVLDHVWRNMRDRLSEDTMREYRYFRGNANRMRYDEDRANEWFVGFGVIESGCATDSTSCLLNKAYDGLSQWMVVRGEGSQRLVWGGKASHREDIQETKGPADVGFTQLGIPILVCRGGGRGLFQRRRVARDRHRPRHGLDGRSSTLPRLWGLRKRFRRDEEPMGWGGFTAYSLVQMVFRGHSGRSMEYPPRDSERKDRTTRSPPPDPSSSRVLPKYRTTPRGGTVTIYTVTSEKIHRTYHAISTFFVGITSASH